MRERRGKKRFKRRFIVRYGERELSHSGFTRDISRQGAFIISPFQPPLDSNLHLQIFLPKERSVYFEATVRRHKVIPPQLRSLEKGGFGVRFLMPHEILQRMLVEAGNGLEITYAAPQDLKQAYEKEFRHGGVFVPTEREFERGSNVLLSVRVDFAKRILEFETSVVHVWANASQTVPRGVGLVFNDRNEVEAAIEPFVGKSDGR
jgi:Tfp pilus assembly protein PilZ